MSYIDWSVAKVIENTEIRLPKEYFVKLNRSDVFGLKNLTRSRKIIYVWVEDDTEYMIPRKLSKLDLEKEKITVRDKYGYGLLSFYSIYKPKNVKEVEEEIRNSTPTIELSYDYEHVHPVEM